MRSVVACWAVSAIGFASRFGCGFVGLWLSAIVLAFCVLRFAFCVCG